MQGTYVNPATLRPGDVIATGYNESNLNVWKSRKIQRVGVCPSQPEKVHIDHECYDTRFSRVVTVK